jgi:hypothetical protein
MSRSGVYYAIKAMDRTIAGAAAADAPRAPARSNGRIFAQVRHVLAKVHNGGADRRADRGRRSLRGAAGAD